MKIYINRQPSLPQQVDKNTKDIAEIKENPKIINWTGEWISGTIYSYGQGVEYQGSSYVFKGETDLESTVAPSSDSEHWQLLAEKGQTGEQGETGAPGQDGQNGQDGANGVGIASIEKTSTVGLVDTYTITLTNGQTSTFTVTNGQNGQNGQDGQDGANGVGIASIEKTSTVGLVDTYTITLTNGQTSTFTVTNGSLNIYYMEFKKNDTRLYLNPAEDTKITGFTKGPRNEGTGIFSLDSDAGELTVTGVQKIKITSVMQFYQNSASTRFSNSVKRNGNNVNNTGNFISLSSANQYGRVCLANVVCFDVNNGDIITFECKSENSDPSNKDYVMGTETHFIIEVVKM